MTVKKKWCRRKSIDKTKMIEIKKQLSFFFEEEDNENFVHLFKNILLITR